MKTHHRGAIFALLACTMLGFNSHAADSKPDTANTPAETAAPATNSAATPGSSVGNQGQQPAGTGIGGSSGSTGDSTLTQQLLGRPPRPVDEFFIRR